MSKESIDQALKAPREDVTVADGKELLLDPQKIRGYHTVSVASFEDLQALRLIPPALEERSVREAIAADDVEARAVASQLLGSRTADCGCDGASAGAARSSIKLNYRQDSRATYVGVRKAHNPRLAAVMTQATGVQHAFFDLHPAMVHGWLVRLGEGRIHLPIFTLKDVVIGKNATLKLQPTLKYLGCNALKIHVGGKLLATGSGIKITCASAYGQLA